MAFIILQGDAWVGKLWDNLLLGACGARLPRNVAKFAGRSSPQGMIESEDCELVDAGPGDAGKRLDRFLAERFDELSRSRLQALIRSGCVSCALGRIEDPGAKVQAGVTYHVILPEPEPAVPAAQSIPLSIVHEDEHLIVIDKPAGLVVHPGPGNEDGTLVNALIAHCGDSLSGVGGVRRPGIVHRLDKDTSGLMVVAKTDVAHQNLSEQFAAHGRDGRLHRIYTALVWGTFLRPAGTIDAPIGRSVQNRRKMAVVKEHLGRTAVTHYELEAALPNGDPKVSLLRLKLETGRTHQIRVHMAHVGHPLLGDGVYGTGFKASAARLSEAAQAALHLSLIHI